MVLKLLFFRDYIFSKTWKLDYIKQILIPTLDKKIMSDIHNIIIKSKQAIDESKRLIDLSKNKIEKMIDDIIKRN